MFFLTFLIFCLSTGGLCQDWVNDYDGYLYYECPEGESISRMTSIHSNHDEDRRWAFECDVLEHGYDTCTWSGFVNDWDQVDLLMMKKRIEKYMIN